MKGDEVIIILKLEMQSPGHKNRSRFKDKYEALERIGAGKMGVIYKVRKLIRECPEQQQFYAAKHISLHKVDEKVARQQLKILEQLKHVYIVKYYEDFIENDELILIMDFCGEKDLAYHIERMKKNGKHFNQNLVSTWIFQLILVIEYIHSMNVVHRDIKPQNIFVDKDMNLKIGDFGVSKLMEGTENCKTMAGSPLYFSPELSKNQKYTNKTDIWSLGCVIFQICTLQRPFNVSKQGLIGLFKVIQTKDPKNIPSLYSPDLNKLIRKMMTKQPIQRPTARQLLQDPILVQLMINYSSQVNLKDQYEDKAVEKPTLTDSFIENKTNDVQCRMKQFEEEVKMKMESLKNKKVKSSQIDKYYSDIQKKMKDLEKVMQIAFLQLKMKSEPDNKKMEQSMRMDMGKTIRNSSLSASGETLQSINLGTVSKVKQSRLKQSQQLNGEEDDSMQSVQSILIQSKIKDSSPKKSSLFNTMKQSTKLQQSEDLDATIQSQFLATIHKSQNLNQIKDNTVNHLEQISQEIINNPDLLLDQTFLTMSLSVSSNGQQMLSQKTLGKSKKGINFGTSIGSSYGDSINFDFSKKNIDEGKLKQMIEEEESEEEIQEQATSKINIQCEEDDSLDQYEADFESYEEDKEMDIRQQQRQSVRELFTSTVKSFNMNNNSSNGSYMSSNSSNKGGKYNPSLSIIREQSNDGSSVMSAKSTIQ